MLTCPICKKEFISKNRGKRKQTWCSKSCAAKKIRKQFILRKGYKYIKNVAHPFATLQGYVSEHRLVVEGYIGRMLTGNEVVHHLNNNILDNRIENLVIMTDSEHKSFHAKNRKDRKTGQFI